MLDKRILEQLFRQNYSEMTYLARILLGDDAEAEDVVQDIFLRVAEADLPPRKEGYLLTAVRNACLNRIRQMQVRAKVKSLLPVGSESNQQLRGATEERADDISAYVDEHLQEPHRSIFHLRFDDDLTIAEIARRLHLNPNTTYKYLAQSIQQIRRHFKR